MTHDPRPAVSRRRFLRLGIGGAAALGVGGVLAWQTGGYDVPVEVARRLVALRPKTYRIVEAIASRMLRPDGPGLPTAADVGAAAFIDRFVARLDEASRTDLLRLLHLVEHALPPMAGHLGRFTRLSGEAQDDVLEAMMTSRTGLLRGAFGALESLCVMAYFRDERTWGAIGYDGPLVGRPVDGWIVPLARARRHR